MIANFILLTGEDDYRLQARKNFYRDSFSKKYPEGSIEYFDVENTFAEIQNTVFTPSLFGGRRLILTEDFWTPDIFELAQKSDFFSHFAEMADSCTIIALEPHLDKRTSCTKFLLKEAKIESFDPLEKPEILCWMQDFVQARGGKLAPSVSQKLLDRCGEDLWHLSRELEKLITAGRGEILEADVQELTLANPSIEIWDFLGHLSRRNSAAALKKFRELLASGTSVHEIFPMIQREIRIHAQLRYCLDQKMSSNKIASESKIHPYVVQKTLPLTHQFSSQKIREMYDALFSIDQQLKSGKISVSTDDQSELELALEKFILRVCQN